jgi:hypothetical protein
MANITYINIKVKRSLFLILKKKLILQKKNSQILKNYSTFIFLICPLAFSFLVLRLDFFIVVWLEISL